MTSAISDELKKYWEEIATTFSWKKKWDKVQSGDFNNVNIKWFEGGQLNITENCLDRHLKDKANKTALIFEPNHPEDAAQSFTYQELYNRVCEFSNVLKNCDVKKGDVVCLYMGMTPELMIALLACARIGAIHSVVFGGFSSIALNSRLVDSKAKVLITHDGSFRGEKIIPLKPMVDEALELPHAVQKVIVVKRTNTTINMHLGRDYFFDDLKKSVNSHCDAVKTESEDPLFILYTSGSTGKPKGLLHTVAGYMVYAAKSFKEVFSLKDDDIFWCTADIGWITGHTYLTYAPLLNGSTTILFEGIPNYPGPDRFWEVIEKHKVTIFYTAPTAIRSLQKFGSEIPDRYPMKSLRVLGSVGEPINEEAWHWYDIHVGKTRCPIVDTWWQTETGGIMISPIAGITKLKPAHATLPLKGIEAVLINEKGVEVNEIVAEGNLCIKTPWPGMARSIYGDHARFIQTYFTTYKGYYFTGDGAKRDEDNYFRITGRVDDVINVSGHRIGTAEVEDAINEHPNVTESAVVGFAHNVKGQGIYSFITLNTSHEVDKSVIEKEIMETVTKLIGPIARPDVIQITEGLPKTRSGKIMRRILRKIVENDLENIGDTSTLLNPECVEKIIKGKCN